MNKKTECEEKSKTTEILCVECLKGRLIVISGSDAICNKCGTEFTLTGKNSYRYK